MACKHAPDHHYWSIEQCVFDASRSSSIYGNSTTVQTESHDWIVCVVAFGTATNVGSVDVANVMSAVNQTQLEINQVQSKINQVQSEIKIVLPVGSVIASAMNTTPDGYLICNGAAISRTTYAALLQLLVRFMVRVIAQLHLICRT